ncbi:hypothetical protein ACRCUN_27115 [Mycobacterium sp. LTG2003]
MQRPEIWKVMTVGLALTGLGLVGAGTAFADSTPPAPVTAVNATLAFDDDDDWGDDDWYGHDDWDDD